MSMWRPPQRIRHDAQPGQWPSAAEAERSRLFAPVRVGGLQLSQRTWVPAMVPWRASEDGLVTPSVLAWYGRFARGRPGAIVVEATGIRDVASGPLLRIGEARFIAGLSQLVETVRRTSAGETRLFIQLIDFLSIRRRPEAQKYFERFLAITPQHRRALNMPDSTEDEVRARLAALDSTELADVLGARELEALRMGAREHRVRLPLEVLAAVRAMTSGDFVVGARILAEECIVGGSSVSDSEFFAGALAARAPGACGSRLVFESAVGEGGCGAALQVHKLL
jgi:2,4-dienoyl-CoA reductase-like NADH-dependent reductase (Old Yellow Enzyme family)